MQLEEKKDHSDSDIKFAYNLKIKFRTPEYIFLFDTHSKGILKYPIIPFNKNLVNYQYNYSKINEFELIILVGFPASGKSYTAKQIKEYYLLDKIINNNKCNNNLDIISLDDLKTKSKFITHLKKSIISKHNIIVDNTNLDIASRKVIIDILKDYDKYNNYYLRIIYVNTPLERCIHNNYYRYLIFCYKTDTKFIPEFVFKMMNKKLKIPSYEENTRINQIDIITTGIPLTLEYLYYFY